MKVTLDGPWLEVDLARPRRVLSFAPHRPGFVTARRILWREVRNDDLTPDFDALGWLRLETARRDPEAVAMMTSRQVARFREARMGPVQVVATVGLGNAERIGHRRPPREGYGTINIAVLIAAGLTETAMIEALSIIAEARTAALIDAALPVPGGLATGTGTDCIALACDPGEIGFCGLHTALGEALGRAVHGAVLAGATEWLAERAAQPEGCFGAG